MGRARALAFTSLGHFANDGATSFLPLMVDLLLSLKGATPLEVSLLLFLFYSSSAVSSVFVGREADKTGTPGRLIAIGIACLGVGLGGFALIMRFAPDSGTFVPALACDLIMGGGSAFYHPLGGSVLQTAFGRGSIGRALGLNGSMGSLGRALYPSLFFVLAAALTTPGSLAFLGLVGLGASLLIWFGLRGAEVPREKEAQRPSIRGSLTKPMLFLLAVAFFMQVAFFGVTSYLPIFLTTQRGLGITARLGLYVTVLYVSAIPGQPFFGFLADRLDRRLVLAIAGFGAGASIVGFVATRGIESLVLLSLFGLFAYTGFPLLLSLASDYAPEGARALGNSLIWGLGVTAGDSLGPVLVYAIVLSDYSRLGTAFEVMAAIAVLSAVGALLMPRPKALSPVG
jgi:MFS transporter, FSR family, fosmidomycin resistance protein